MSTKAKRVKLKVGDLVCAHCGKTAGTCHHGPQFVERVVKIIPLRPKPKKRTPRDKASPWQRIVRAAESGRGVRLSAYEVGKLWMDDAITTRARLDDANENGHEGTSADPEIWRAKR